METVKIKVDVVSDTVCPWCFLGKLRLEEAINIAAKDISKAKVEVETIWHPYFLSADLLKKPSLSIPKSKVYLKRFKGNQGAVEAMVSQFKQLFKEHGVAYSFGGNISHTLHSHRLVEYARAKYGNDMANKVVHGMFVAYHCDQKTPSDIDTLKEVAAKVGLPLPEVESFLRSNEFVDTVLDDVTNPMFKSQTGVPHYKFSTASGTEFELPGAQDVSYFVRLISRLVDIELEKKQGSKI